MHAPQVPTGPAIKALLVQQATAALCPHRAWSANADSSRWGSSGRGRKAGVNSSADPRVPSMSSHRWCSPDSRPVDGSCCGTGRRVGGPGQLLLPLLLLPRAACGRWRGMQACQHTCHTGPPTSNTDAMKCGLRNMGEAR